MATTHSIDLEAGSSQSLSITDGDQTGLDLSTDFTIEAWIKLESLISGDGVRVIAGKAGATSADFSYDFRFETADADSIHNQLRVLWRDSSNNLSRFNANLEFDSGDLATWIHVAVVVNISTPTVLFYMNGVVMAGGAVNTAATAIRDTSEPFVIGAENGASFFDGLIMGLRVWSDLRTADEILQYKNVQLLGTEANLVASWPLDDSLLDQTSNDNDLTNNNSAVFVEDVPPVEATPFFDDFESYDVGALDGHGGWDGSTDYRAETTEVKEGVNAMGFHTTAVALINKVGTLVDDGRCSFYFYKSSHAARTYVYLNEGTSDVAIIYINDSGNIQYYSAAAYHDIQAYNESQWYLVETEWRSVDHKMRHRIDGGTWTSWFAPFAAWTYGISRFGMTSRDYSVSEYFYLDYIAEDPLPSSSIKSINGLAYASIKSVNGLAIASVKSFDGL